MNNVNHEGRARHDTLRSKMPQTGSRLRVHRATSAIVNIPYDLLQTLICALAFVFSRRRMTRFVRDTHWGMLISLQLSLLSLPDYIFDIDSIINFRSNRRSGDHLTFEEFVGDVTDVPNWFLGIYYLALSFWLYMVGYLYHVFYCTLVGFFSQDLLTFIKYVQTISVSFLSWTIMIMTSLLILENLFFYTEAINDTILDISILIAIALFIIVYMAGHLRIGEAMALNFMHGFVAAIVMDILMFWTLGRLDISIFSFVYV